MRFFAIAFAAVALAARPFLEEPDTGIDDALGLMVANGSLPPLDSLVGIPDFQWAARHYLNASSYSYYRNGAGGEWSYRNNLEVFQRYKLRPRVMNDITKVPQSLRTTILGYNFSAPFFISPCARGGFAHPDGELNLVRGAAASDILYIASLYATKSVEEIAAAKGNMSQVVFQQMYVSSNMTDMQQLFRRIEASGSKAIIVTVDAPGDGIRHRAARYGVGVGSQDYQNINLDVLTWDLYRQLSEMTYLPLIPKGIQTVDDARAAVENGVKAIFLSNHGGRQIDGSPSSLEVALEIHQQAPEIFQQVEVYADGAIRYGTDILKLLSLGVRAVGLGRPFMYSNIYGTVGVKKVADILKYELINDAANLGVSDIKKLGPEFVDWKAVNQWYS